jgi:hypothetical protein
MSQTEQPILIITGMHRSGTSLVSSLLASAGLDIGKNLVGANEGNPKGHFENIELVNFHESVLFSLGIDKIGWTQQYKLTPPPSFFEQAQGLIEQNKSLTKPWGWKEPRTTLFLDFWANLLPNAKFLFVFRRPWEVVDSLYRRGDDIFYQNPQFALQVWLSYNQALLDFQQQFAERCLIYNLNQIIANPNQLITHLQEKLDISLSQPLAELYEDNLLKQDVSTNYQRLWIIKNYFPSALDIYQQLNQQANYEDTIINQLTEIKASESWALKDWLDVRLLERKIQHEQKDYHNHLHQLYQDLGTAQGKIQALTTDLEELHYSNAELIATNNQLNADLTQVKEESSQLRADIEQLHFQISQLNSLLEQYDAEAKDIHSRYADLYHYAEQLKQESAQQQSQAEQIKSQLEAELNQERCHRETVQQRIIAMETSKFWQLRKQWFNLKKLVGMGDNE